MIFFLFAAFTLGVPSYDPVGTRLTIIGNGNVSYNEIHELSYTTFTSVIIKDDIEGIDDNAFADCTSLENISLPESLLFIGKAFQKTKIRSLHIPSKVKYINYFQFMTENLAIEEISVDTNNFYFASYDGCLYTRNLTFLIYCPRLKRTVSFPSIVEEFESWSFNGNSKLDLTIPDSVSRWRNYIFIDCSFQDIRFTPNSKLSALTTECFHQVGFTNAFLIPPAVTIIKSSSFWYSGIKEISFMANSHLETLEKEAFLNCKSLRSVSLPSSVSSVHLGAFSGCTAIAEFIIPDSNHYVNLDGCVYSKNLSQLIYVSTALTEVTIRPNVTEIASNTLQRCLKLTDINITGSETFAAKGVILYSSNFKEALYAAGSATKVEFHSNTTKTAKRLFDGMAKLTEVTFPVDSVMEILSEYTFYGCTGLKTINLPESLLEIQGSCFRLSGLTRLCIPVKTKFTGSEIFMSCRELKSIEYHYDNVDTSIKFRMFLGCSKLTSIKFSDNIKIISSSSFSSCNLTNIEFPSNINNIQDSSFSGNKYLRNVTFNGNSLKSIGDLAFKDTSIESIIFPTSLSSIGKDAFKGIKALKNISFGNNLVLTSIGISFNDCTSLESFTFPYAVQSINPASFKGCVNLREFRIESFSTPDPAAIPRDSAPDSLDGSSPRYESKNGVLYKGSVLMLYPPGKESHEVEPNTTSIASGAFNGASGLKALTFNAESKVSLIGEQTFIGCVNLGEILIPKTVRIIQKGAFIDCIQLKIIKFAKDSILEEIGSNTFIGCVLLEKIIFEGDCELKTIGANTFDGCENLLSITLPSSITNIGSYAFRNCPKLIIVHFQNNSLISSIPMGCFLGCTSLADINLSSEIEVIGPSAFERCSNLTEIGLSTNLKTIGKRAFSGSSLQVITLPTNIERIEDLAFEGIQNLQHVFYCGSKKLNQNVFENCNKSAFGYVMVSYFYDNLGGLPISKLMLECMSIPSLQFTRGDESSAAKMLFLQLIEDSTSQSQSLKSPEALFEA